MKERERRGREWERERIFVSKRRSHRRSHGVTSIALPRKRRDSDVRGEEVHAKHARTGRTTTTKTVGETPNSEEAHCPLNGTLSSTNNTVQLLNTNHRHAPIAPMYLLIYIFQCIESFHSSRFFFAMIITRSSYHRIILLSTFLLFLHVVVDDVHQHQHQHHQ